MSTTSTSQNPALGDAEAEVPTSGYTPLDADDTETDPSLEQLAPFGRGSSGLPLDASGQEWDVVTAEGHGFNDSEGAAQMSPDKSDWGPWATERDLVAFLEAHTELEAARLQGEPFFESALLSHRLRNANQWERVCFTFFRHHPGDERLAHLAAAFEPLLKK